MTDAEHAELLARIDTLEAQVRRLTRALAMVAIVTDVEGLAAKSVPG